MSIEFQVAHRSGPWFPTIGWLGSNWLFVINLVGVKSFMSRCLVVTITVLVTVVGFGCLVKLFSQKIWEMVHEYLFCLLHHTSWVWIGIVKVAIVESSEDFSTKSAKLSLFHIDIRQLLVWHSRQQKLRVPRYHKTLYVNEALADIKCNYHFKTVSIFVISEWEITLPRSSVRPSPPPNNPFYYKPL